MDDDFLLCLFSNSKKLNTFLRVIVNFVNDYALFFLTTTRKLF